MSEPSIAELNVENTPFPEDLLETARRLLRLKAQIKSLQKEETALKGELLLDLKAASQDRLELAEGTVERSVRAMRDLHERLSDPSSGPSALRQVLPKGPGPSPPVSFPGGGPFGGDTPIRTSSPARGAGAPQGAPVAPPSSPPLSAMQTHPSDPRSSGASHLGSAGPSGASVTPPGPGTAGGEGAPARPRGPGDRGETVPTTADLVRRVQLDLTDMSVRRKRAKENATQRMLELRGLRSLRECGSADESALSALLATFEEIDTWDTHEAPGAPPTLDPRLVTPA